MPRGNAARAFGTCLTASRCQDGPVSFHEFTKYDRFRHVSRANGETWTVNIERGNAFQGWSWFNSLYDEWGGSTVLIAAIVDWPFRLAKVITFRARLRRDWRVTVRPGRKSELGARRGAVVDEVLPNKVEAARRANALVREIESGALSERAKSTDSA